jgi:hypothetical protein
VGAALLAVFVVVDRAPICPRVLLGAWALFAALVALGLLTCVTPGRG